jgi:hypothetical protein
MGVLLVLAALAGLAASATKPNFVWILAVWIDPPQHPTTHRNGTPHLADVDLAAAASLY